MILIWRMSVLDAGSRSMTNAHAWRLSDLSAVPKNGLSVMSTFCCGGGSSMGYKRAGYTIVAACDIDPEMAHHYKLNLSPPLFYRCPVKDLLSVDLPDHLYSLDILDGSPPCSTFSTSGLRDKAWGKKKHFREGQAAQVLDDLFFDFLDVVERLRPRAVIAENVRGMIIGKAKGYTKLIMQRFKAIGYRPQLFLINAADCGVPQSRERVFFCALRDDQPHRRLTIQPNVPHVSASDAISDLKDQHLQPETKPSGVDFKWWHLTEPGSSYDKAVKTTGKTKLFSHAKLHPNKPSPTLTTKAFTFKHWSERRLLSYAEWLRFGSFPDDYQAKSARVGQYMVGMSVPPKMTEYVARCVGRQWLGV